jgi:manganese/zinc/iron transport system permease protein
MFVLSLLFAPKRGLIADAARRLSLRRRVQDQNLLREVYERLEPLGDFGHEWTLTELDVATHCVPRLMRNGLVKQVGAQTYTLSPSGQFEAAKVVRAHRLWELFLIQQADIAPDHVDRDADIIEHVLPPSVLVELEERLHAMGRLPLGVPRSPHPINKGATP